MRFRFLVLSAVLIFTPALCFQTANAQAARKLSSKETSLIAHLVKEANEPDGHLENDVYLAVTIGNTQYFAELESGKVVVQNRAGNPSGGFYGAYAEVNVNTAGKDRDLGGRQGGSQILKLTGGKWKRIALNETDYRCGDVKSVPKPVLKALKVECN